MAAQLTVYLLDPTHLVAMSLDGDVNHAGPWQSSPIFTKDPLGNDFTNREYYIHEKDPLTPDKVFPVLVRVYNQALATSGTGKDGIDGKDGTQFYTATVNPSTIGGVLGKDGDFCINKTTGDVFQRFGNLPNGTANTWVLSFNIKGPKGDIGPAGTGSGGGSGPALTYMVPDYSGLEDFQPPGAGHEYDVAGWQVIYNVAQAAFHADDQMQFDIGSLQTALNNKVDKVNGQRLTEQNFSLAEKQKLAASFNYNLPTAKTNELGGVKIGANINAAVDGTISITPVSANGGGIPTALTAFLINSGYTVYAPILNMPASTGGTYDHSILVVGLSEWTSNVKKWYQVSCSARAGLLDFEATIICTGNDSIGGSLRAYKNADNSVTLYIVAPPGFQEVSVTFLKTHQSAPAQYLTFSIGNQLPTGTLVYDSLVTKPDFIVNHDGIATRNLPIVTDPLNVLTRDVMTGKFGAVTLDKMLLALINGAADSTIQAICARLSALGCGNNTPVVTAPVADPVFTFGPHFQSVALPITTPAPLAHDYVVMIGENTCDLVTGAIVDRNYPNVPASVDIFINHSIYATITVTNTRSDLAAQYGGDPGAKYGFVWRKPDALKNGQSHFLNVFAANTGIEATYASAQQTPVCAAPSQTPYVVQYVIGGPTSLGENATIHAYITARYSDGTTQRYASAVAWSISGGTPAGLTLTPTNNTAELDLTMSAIPAGKTSVTLIATIGTGGCEASISLVATACHRPATGLLNVYLAWNYVLSNGDVKTFDSLDNANTTMGKVFNEANIGITGFSKFKAQMANYNVGTEVFLNWSADGDTSCAHVSDRIYYVLDGNGNDSQKQAIYVVNGKIADVKPSTYAVPAQPTTPAGTTVTRVSYSQAGNSLSSQIVSIVLSRATERVEIRGRYRYTSGQIGDYSDWYQINQGNGVSGYITATRSQDYLLEIDVRPTSNPGAAIAHIIIPFVNGDVADTQLYPA